jgi:hypothetical protein
MSNVCVVSLSSDEQAPAAAGSGVTGGQLFAYSLFSSVCITAAAFYLAGADTAASAGLTSGAFSLVLLTSASLGRLCARPKKGSSNHINLETKKNI